MTRKTLLAVTFVLACLPGFSQVATGTYSYGSFDTLGFDTIDRGSLNVYFTIPVVNKPGRGLPFQYSLNYNGLIWSPGNISGTQTWTPNASFGLNGALLNVGYKGYLSYISGTRVCTPPGGTRGTYLIEQSFEYHDQFGVTHPFSYEIDECTPASSVSNKASYDGYMLNSSLNGVITPSGTSIGLPVNVSGAGNNGNASATDSNGNSITTNSSGGYTDITGAIILKTSGSGTASSPEVFTYLTLGSNPNGTTPPSASVTITYITHTVQTAFGCNGVGEYNQSVDLIDKITLADSSFYQFKYEATPGNSSNVTGRLASITLPQGGTISYSYTGGSNGINCADGTPTGITRTTSDGTRKYVRSLITTTSSQTTVTDGSNNASTYKFVTTGSPTAFYETNRSNYQGAASGTPLVSRQTCYNGSTSPCSTTAVTLPITQIDTYESINGGGEHGATAKYNSYGLQTEQDIYDYGSTSARGNLLLKELWAYPSSGIVNLLSSDTVQDGSGNQIGLTTYAYDETSGADHAALVATSGLPQHSGTVGSQRGNLTTLTQWNNLGTSITTTSAYEDTGNPVNTTTPNGSSTFAYDPATHAFVNTATPPTPSSGVSLSSSATSDVGTGLPLTSVDPNGQTTTYKSYNALLQPLEIDNPDGGKTVFTYSSPNIYVVQPYQNANNSVTVYHDIDSYGRADRVSAFNGQSGAQWYQQDTCFDANSNVQFQTYTYQGTGLNGAKICSGTGNSYTYDALGRVLSTTHADGTTINYTYTGRATKVVDENSVTRVTQVDGLGRITSVCEVSSQPQQGVNPGTCSQDISSTGFATIYSYTTDSSDDQVTTIAQYKETRTFVTDSLGRTVSKTEPERGTTTYSYAYDSTGLVVTRKRPKANQTTIGTLTTTTTQYDALGRMIGVSYDDSLTPTKTYSYDVSNWAEGGSQQNLKGRLSLAYTSTAGTLYSYDQLGRVTGTWQCTPSTCGTASKDRSMTFTYDWAGFLLSQSDAVSGTIAYGRSPAGEITSIGNSTFQNSGNPANLVSNIVNGPNGSVSYQLGNGLNVYKAYDNMGRGIGRWLCNGPAAQQCSGGTTVYGNGLQFKGSQVPWNDDTVVNLQLVYGYDTLNRLTSTSLYQASSPLYTYSYDLYGNRWSQTSSGGSTFSASFDPTTNRINSAGYAYDAAGNMTNDSVNTYTFDAEGNILNVGGGSTAKYVYDALNQRVQNQVGSSTLEYVYDANGRRVSTWAEPANTGTEGRIYSDSQQIAFRASDGTTYFDHQDYLGTERIRTTSTGAVAATYSSLPWGDGYSANISKAAGDQDSAHFAELDQDLNSANAAMSEHAQFRNYSFQQGRWLSPDPYDGSYDPSNPQSFNRYAYVLNNPMSLNDPSGLLTQGPQCGVNAAQTGCSAPPPTTSVPPPWWILTYGGTYGQPGGQCLLSDGAVVVCPQQGTTKVAAPSNLVPTDPCAYQGKALPPSAYAAAGAASNIYSSPLSFAADIKSGGWTGYLNSQPLNSGSTQQNAAYGNYVFGVYMQTAGLTLSQALGGANAFAAYRMRSNPNQYAGQQMDQNYPSLPGQNVANITNGFNAQANGTTCHK